MGTHFVKFEDGHNAWLNEDEYNDYKQEQLEEERMKRKRKGCGCLLGIVAIVVLVIMGTCLGGKDKDGKVSGDKKVEKTNMVYVKDSPKDEGTGYGDIIEDDIPIIETCEEINPPEPEPEQAIDDEDGENKVMGFDSNFVW